MMHRTTLAVAVLLSSAAAVSTAHAQFPPQHGHSQEHQRAVMLWQDDLLLSGGCDAAGGWPLAEATCGWPEMQPSADWIAQEPGCGGAAIPGPYMLGRLPASQRTGSFSPLQYVRRESRANKHERGSRLPVPPPAVDAEPGVRIAVEEGRADPNRGRAVHQASAGVVVRLDDAPEEAERRLADGDARKVSSRRLPALKRLGR